MKPSAAQGTSVEKASRHTPMMVQFHAIKAQYPDCLLFFRLGDFYEMFFEDAEKASAALDITLTKRGRHEGKEIPMCGVPFHSSDNYLARLIRQGYRVAICEQVEDPEEAKKRPGSTIVKRDVVRVVTPGTLTEDALLKGRKNNFLAAICQQSSKEKRLSIAFLDISTGEFYLQTLPLSDLFNALSRLRPSEIILSQKLIQRPELYDVFRHWKTVLTCLPNSRFDEENGRRLLTEIYRVQTLDAFGDFSATDLMAAGSLLDYVQLTQKSGMPRLDPLKRLHTHTYLEVDFATQQNLELLQTLSGEKKGSLLSTLDKTVTNGGARLFARRLVFPLTDISAIQQRHETVAYFLQKQDVQKNIIELLKQCPDLERALARLTLGRGGPRDLAAIKDGLKQTIEIRRRLCQEKGDLTENLKNVIMKLGIHGNLVDRLSRALKDDLPYLAREGGFLAKGYHEKLDELIDLRDQAQGHLKVLEDKYIHSTGIKTLKVKHNHILGVFVEVPGAQAEKLSPEFIHRQTLVNNKRYTTAEITELQHRIDSSAEEALKLELHLFDDLVKEVTSRAEDITRVARGLAILDVMTSLARLAKDHHYCRPEIDDSLDFHVTGGRHPVVEQMLPSNQDFVQNDCECHDRQKILLLTGPNMAGKSTYLRQNALIILMAQMGSFVPAEKARLGVVDRLFSRVGAADDLARGRSTFMVEMIETAAILNQATRRSFVILDEVGRGTSTYDGVSIAWASVEHLHTVNACRALFATHYHELTDLEDKLSFLKCFTIDIKEWKGKVLFLHKVIPGKADRSYGVHVAQLAGMPHSVIKRAEDILVQLEASSSQTSHSSEGPPQFSETPSEVVCRLQNTHVDDLTPREALDFVYELKASLE